MLYPQGAISVTIVAQEIRRRDFLGATRMEITQAVLSMRKGMASPLAPPLVQVRVLSKKARAPFVDRTPANSSDWAMRGISGIRRIQHLPNTRLMPRCHARE